MRVTARSTGVIVGLTIAILIGTGAMLAIAHSNWPPASSAWWSAVTRHWV